MSNDEFYDLNDKIANTANMQNMFDAIDRWMEGNDKKKLTQYYESGKYDAFFDVVREEYDKDHGDVKTFFRGICIEEAGDLSGGHWTNPAYEQAMPLKVNDKIKITASKYPLQSFSMNINKAREFAQQDGEAENNAIAIVMRYDMPNNDDWRIVFYHDFLEGSSWGTTSEWYKGEQEVVLCVEHPSIIVSAVELYVMQENEEWLALKQGQVASDLIHRSGFND